MTRISNLYSIALLAVLGLAIGGCGDSDETETPDNGSGGETPEGFDPAAWFSDAARATQLNVDPQLGDGASTTAPNFVPAAGGPAASGAKDNGGGFFVAANYLGAFEPGGADWTAGWSVWATGPVEAGDRPVETISGNVAENVTWTADKVYQLTGEVYVTGGATLTIEPGTLVVGDVGSALIVTRNGQLIADGTAELPITFTSSKPVAERVAGDWGGIVMLGSAPINVQSNNIEGLAATEDSAYGGSDSAHNCGTLRYARIEYAGSVFGTDNELNSLTLGGCGSDTTLAYIHTFRGLDDGIEFFGGSANLRYGIVSYTGDDSLDWDEGYVGNIQFFVAQQGANEGDRAIEADNQGDAPTATPLSDPTLYNVTLVGGGNPEQEGVRLRAGTAGALHNFIVTGFGKAALKVDGAESEANILSGALEVSHGIFHNSGAGGTDLFY
jgi:hypothetical protein